MRLSVRIASAALALVATTGLVAATFAPATAAPAAVSTRVAHLVFDTKVSSIGTTLTTLPGGITFGWNQLAGRTQWNGRGAKVAFLGDVNYKSGNGPFNGYVTITRTDGAALSVYIAGQALSIGDGTTSTKFSGTVTVIGGTKALRGATGAGSMTGQRLAALGSPVEMTLDLDAVLKS